MFRKMVCGLALFGASVGVAQATTLDDIQLWAGSGENRAGMVVHWSEPEVFNNTSMPAPVDDVSFSWGYKFDGAANAENMMVALAEADPRLYLFAGGQPNLGMAILGIGYDYDNDGQFGLTDGTTSHTQVDFTNGILANQAYNSGDAFVPTDDGDLYWGGWYGPNWELWHEQNGNGEFDEEPDRGTDTYWTSDDGFSGTHGEWSFSGMGISGLDLEDGSWVGWSVAAAGLEFGTPAGDLWASNKQAPAASIPIPEPATLAMLGIGGLLGLGRRRKRERAKRHDRGPRSFHTFGLAIGSMCLMLCIGAVSPADASPYATTLVDSGGTFGNSPYDDPNAILGGPATDFYDNWAGFSGGSPNRRVKLVEPAFNTDADGNKLITTFNDPSYAIVGFDDPIENDPLNPYGQDFLVFGNAFYAGNGFVTDSTDMNTYTLTGGGFFENVLVSVSQGPAYEGQPHTEWTWYTYTDGPYGDNAFPTHAYEWDQDKYVNTGNGWTDELMDFTKPVNPDYYDTLMDGGISGADAIELYEGSGGGTGFDLDALADLYPDLTDNPLQWIQYIKVEGTTGFAGGEIDAFSDVVPIPEPASLAMIALGGLALMRRR